MLFYLLLALFHQARYSPAGYARNLLVGYPFHFIPLLTVCYLLSPVLVSVGRRHGWLMLGAIGLYQLFLIVLGEPARYGLPSDTPLRLLVPPVLGTTLTSWAIYFPLGVVFSLHAATLRPHLQRWWPLFAVATVLLFGTGLLDAFQYIDAPFARHLCPVTLLLVVPVIERNRIPWVRRLEQIGKRSYGLYLTHLIVLDLSVLAIMAFIPWLFSTPALLFPLLYVVALQVPLQIMEWMARKPIQKNYRYVFG